MLVCAQFSRSQKAEKTSAERPERVPGEGARSSVDQPRRQHRRTPSEEQRVKVKAPWHCSVSEQPKLSCVVIELKLGLLASK